MSQGNPISGPQPYGTVVEVEHLTPRLVRIVLGGEGLNGFVAHPSADAYVSVLIAPGDAPFTPPFDADELRDAGFRAARRRYTVRNWDAEQGLLTIDFVVHGDTGAAGRWANGAKPGDTLQLSHSTGGYQPDPDADWYLFVGDESALPAIANCVESVASDKPVLTVLLVDDDENHVALDGPSGLDVTWVHRCDGDDPSGRFVAAVQGLEFPSGRVSAFVHGEAGETREVRKHLLGDRGVAREDASISPYWRRGKTDEAWREIKREWIAEQENDLPG